MEDRADLDVRLADARARVARDEGALERTRHLVRESQAHTALHTARAKSLCLEAQRLVDEAAAKAARRSA